jgi:glyoxylase-like metal-dependent hydrolase (beta-lactamase superfamily II)
VSRAFEVVEVQSGLWRLSDPGYAQPSHAYLLLGSDRAALIDAGCGILDIRQAVQSLTNLDVTVLQTHAHPDHAGGSHQFDVVWAHPKAVEKLESGWSNLELKFTLERYIDPDAMPDGMTPDTFHILGCASVQPLEDRGFVDLGGRQLDVFFTPGHSDDSVCFLDLERELLFTGDSVLKGQVAVENSLAYRRSLQDLSRLAELSNHIFPGHGASPIEPSFVSRLRQGFTDAVADRRPSGFLAGFATFDFEDFGIMLPPRRRRLQDE